MIRRGPVNPYIAGRPIIEPYGFYGRVDLVKAVVNALTTTRQNAIILHGLRCIGKSSVLYCLQRDETLQRDHLPILFDLRRHEAIPPPRILIGLAETILDELNLSIPLPDEASLTADYHQFQQTFLPEIYRHLDHKRLLLLLDEFDVVVPPDTADLSPADTLFGYLQTLIEEEQEHLAFVVAVGRRLDLLAEGYKHLFKGSRAELVGCLTEEDTYGLLTDLGRQGGVSYTKEALAAVWALTNGHPYVTQLIGFEIFGRLKNLGSQQAKPADVEACLADAMKHRQAALDDFWQGFNCEQQLILAAVAELTARQQSINGVEIEAALQQHNYFLSQVDRRNAYTQLTQCDFLIKTDGPRYRFAVEFIRSWIFKQHSLKEFQRQADERSPQAQADYKQGLRACQKKDWDDAIQHLSQAVQDNPCFSRAWLALARAHCNRGEAEVAIEEYEKAYQLGAADAHDELIGLRLNCARNLFEKGAKGEAALAQVQRILQIDPAHTEARQLLSDSYLPQIDAHLKHGHLDEAVDIAQNLVDLRYRNVNQRVRDLWLDYSHMLTQQKQPKLKEAQQTLDKLATLGLLDGEAISAYNRVILDKAGAYLREDKLDQALATLQDELKEQQSDDDVKRLLLTYKDRLAVQQQWSQAIESLKGLYQITGDEDDRDALRQLYLAWGKIHLDIENFDRAIEIYRQAETWQNGLMAAEFRPRIARALLGRANKRLRRHELTVTRDDYKQALDLSNTDTSIRDEARRALKAYFKNRLRSQQWAQAGKALEMLQALDLADAETLAWQADLYLDQAKAELARGRVRSAFQLLTNMSAPANTSIKDLIRTYVHSKAESGQWHIGAVALKHLEDLAPDDFQITSWRANWLFSWAQAMFPTDPVSQKPARAEYLCRQTLNRLKDLPDDLPVDNLLTEVAHTTAALRCQVYDLLAKVLLTQAQSCLDQDNLDAAQKLFKRALDLPTVPGNLVVDINERLQTFSLRQILREEQTLAESRAQARQALAIALDFGLDHHQVSQMLTNLAMRQAELWLKANRPDLAFACLNHLKTEIKRLKTKLRDEERQTVKRMVYHFSRLYTGQGDWAAAHQVLNRLCEWLPPTDKAEIASLLDVFNHERLDFVRSKRLPSKPIMRTKEEIDALVQEVEVAKIAYRDAEALKIKSQHCWYKDFSQASLELAQAHLANDNLVGAIETYQNMLEIDPDLTGNRDLVSHSLYNYSEWMLNQSKLDEARLALAELKNLNLPAPDGLTRPDPRVEGALQQIILRQAQTLLKANQVKAAFDHLKELPTPWPVAEIKRIIRDYSQNCRTQNNWPQAIGAWQQLVDFLAGDPESVGDEVVWPELVESLAAWGRYEEERENLVKVVELYDHALKHTPQTALSKRTELAAHRIGVALQQAQNCLKRDPLTSETPPVLDQAIQLYQAVLGLPEHRYQHKEQIIKALYGHAHKLAEARQWPRAHQVLDYIDKLYPTPRDYDNTLFATWRRDLVFTEVQMWLTERQLDPAFARLKELKNWLDKHQAPKVAWFDTKDQVKALVYNNFCQVWLKEEAWKLTLAALARLAILLPDDEIIGWEVKIHYDWGQALHRQSLLTEAQKHYKEAEKKAINQDVVPIAQIKDHLRKAQLDEAQHNLKKPRHWHKATSIYLEILQQPNDRPDLANQIRQALVGYINFLTAQTPPQWQDAHKILRKLKDLHLCNSQVFALQQTLILQEMKARLQRNDLKGAFNGLNRLEGPWPLEDILAIVDDYCQTRAGTDTWRQAIEVLSYLGEILKEDTTVRHRIFNKSMALAKLFEGQKNNLGLIAAAELAALFNSSSHSV